MMLDNKKELAKSIASERIEILFSLAEHSVKDSPEFSARYIRLMRRISAHYKVTLPKKIKNYVCTRCDILLYPGITATVRVVSSSGYIAYKCKKCGRESHIRYQS